MNGLALLAIPIFVAVMLPLALLVDLGDRQTDQAAADYAAALAFRRQLDEIPPVVLVDASPASPSGGASSWASGPVRHP